MDEYEVRASTGKVYRIHAESPESACIRVADLYGVTVVAWRYPRVKLQIGIGRGVRIIG